LSEPNKGAAGSDAPVKRPRISCWGATAAIVLAAGCGYANALLNGFALDDQDVIARNPLVHSLAGVGRAFVHTYWPESTRAGQYRPLAIASFAIDWSVSHGAPMWLHAVNIGWHIAACLLVWRLLSAIVSPSGALAGALLFAIHPVHVEAVANLVGRSELMCATFVLAALLAHRRGSWWAVALYAAALLSKESGITFVGLAAACDVLLRPVAGGWQPTARVEVPRTGRRQAALYGAYAVATILYGLALGVLFRGTPLVRIAAPWVHTSAPARWLTAISLVPQYVRLMIVPLHLHVDYTPSLVSIAHGVTAGVVAGALTIIAAAAIAVRARRSAPPVTLAIVVFAIAVTPVANLFFASGIMLAERTLYLPSVGLAILAGWLWDLAAASTLAEGGSWRPAPSLGRLLPAAGRWPLAGASVLILAAFAVRTWTRTPVWRDNKSAMVASLRDEPDSYRAHERVADVLQHSADTTGALREYAIARRLYPGDAYLYQAAASIVATRGDSGVAVAERLLDSARLVDPGAYADAMRHAWLRYAMRDYPGTIALAHRAYLMQRDSIDAVMVLAQAAQQIGDTTDAAAAYHLALADHPRNPTLRRSYAEMLMSVGDTAGAARERQIADGSRY
jgi:hypothetical protein